jgi:hypothetical protein
MRKILMIASAAAMAIGMPALAQGKGGGGKPEKHQGGGGGGKPQKAEARGGGGGNPHRAEARGRGNDGFKAERAAARQERRGNGEARGGRARAERQWARTDKRQRQAERNLARSEQRAWKNEAKRVERIAKREDRREIRRVAGEDRRVDGYDYRYRQRYAEDLGGACPPGLARKNNGCLPPGQARKMFDSARAFAAGQVLPLAYYSDYNIPAEYQSWYQDSPDHYYRYDDSGYIYRVDRSSNLIESLIPLLGGGFGVGQLLPAGYDTYNLPIAYRDDYVDSDEAYYRYGDDAIYQVDPQTNMIQAIVALLGGDLNVGGLLPSGYDTYNLPMEYRDQYVDDTDSMYRYADGNIYEIDPQTRIIEQIVASLV